MTEHKTDVSLVNYLTRQRWFGGKARTIRGAQLVEQAEVPASSGKTFRLAIAEVTYVEEPEPERYVLAVAEDDAGQMVEALSDDAFGRALLELVRTQAAIPFGAAQLRGELLPGGEVAFARISSEPKVRRLGVEQSNTSIVFDNELILKLVRKIEPGVNPEYEIGAFLARRDFPHAPRLLGALTLDGPLGTTLGVVHRFTRAVADGWDYAQRALRAAQLPPGFEDEVALLGRRIAEVHLALADSEDPAFAPEPLLAEDFQSWSASIIGELGVSLALAGKTRPELESLREKLVARLRLLAHVEPSGMEIRVHGDLHLGQVLRTERDWQIFDFEGEPARSFNSRRAKHSPLKDVAGMLRSFAYADAMARSGGATADRSHARVVPLRKALLRGYREAMGNSKLLPRGDTFDVLLEALELEKLLYELRYEIQNRPDWVRIPADDLTALESQIR